MNKLLCINNRSIDPYFNLAVEEYLLKNCNNDIFMLWQNEPSIVVGKHQNTFAEINWKFIKENNIKVARRLSGGGTVYHDGGNLNFTYIMNGTEGKLVNFGKYTNDILEVLNALGAPAEQNQRNDLVIDGKKISGNAEHIFKNRVIHHGTLLFNSDLDKLNEAIRIEEGKFEDKSVKSIRSQVTNILPYIKNSIDVEEFKNILINFVLDKYAHAEKYELKIEDNEHINILKNEKYSSWNWIYGYSPKFKFKKAYNSQLGNIQIELLIKKGVFDEIFFNGNLFTDNELKYLVEILRGTKYERKFVEQVFSQNTFVQSKIGISNMELIDLFF